jgi:DNA-binding NarL/FixJ family response regulator
VTTAQESGLFEPHSPRVAVVYCGCRPRCSGLVRTLSDARIADEVHLADRVDEVVPLARQHDSDFVLAAGPSHAVRARLLTLVRTGCSDVSVIAAYARPSVAAVVSDLEDGVCAVVDLTFTPDQIAQAVRTTIDTGMYVPPHLQAGVIKEITRRRSDRARFDGIQDRLTLLEREVLALLAEGRNRTQIAGDLTLSIHSARMLIDGVQVQLGVSSQRAATEAAGHLFLAHATAPDSELTAFYHVRHRHRIIDA